MTTPTYRLSNSEFVRAWEANAFDNRVELIEGQVWPVPISPWHGATMVRVLRGLPEVGAEITAVSLASTDSLLDPDCWVRSAHATPVGELGPRLSL